MNTAGTGPSGTLLLEHQQCVDEAVVEILNATCEVQFQRKEDDQKLTSDGIIIAIISLVGDVEWSIFLGLPRDTAPALAAKFAGFEIPFDSPDMGDAVGELANILAGEVKRRLEAKGVKVDISLPSVIRAESLEVLVQRSADAVKMCYGSPVGTLWTGIAVHKEGGFVA